MGVLKFWGKIPRLVPKYLRAQRQIQHFIPVRFQPTPPPEPDPYAGISRGKKHRTRIENELDRIQACLIADLNCIVDALAKAMAMRDAQKRRRETLPTLDDVLKSIFTGPSSAATLLTKGNAYAREREAGWDLDYRGHLVANKAERLSVAGDVETLKSLITEHVAAIGLLGRARTAGGAIAKGMRKTLRDVAREDRFSDETISSDMFDELPELSIMEMTEFSFASGVNAAHVWQSHHGEPIAIDFHRVYDLAVFAGRLSRGEPALIIWDLVRYISAHHTEPTIENPWRMELFSNTAPVHDAVEWILARIHESYDRWKFLGGLVGCDRPGESRTFRLPPLSP